MSEYMNERSYHVCVESSKQIAESYENTRFPTT